MKWAVRIGRWNIQTTLLSMSSFCEQYHFGHLACLKRMVGFLVQFKDYKIWFRVDKPYFKSVPDIKKQDCKYTPYGTADKDIPLNEPEPCGKIIVLNYYYDSNLIHDIISGRSVTGVILFWNKTPMDWYSRK